MYHNELNTPYYYRTKFNNDYLDNLHPFHEKFSYQEYDKSFGAIILPPIIFLFVIVGITLFHYLPNGPKDSEVISSNNSSIIKN